ncbi:hypothetical protein [Halorubellus litoreus]|uniref:Uncharacterized protein n=1 Tax=Halorubellus litoreus TaxID=755308 RepID=A0ABD5VDB1_9EURY
MSVLRALRTDPSVRRPAIVALALAAFVVAADRVLAAAFASDTAIAPWLPRLGTPGETAMYYLLLVRLVEAVALPAALVWTGYAYGRHTATVDGSADA